MSKKVTPMKSIGILKGVKIWALVAHRAGAEIFVKTAMNAPCKSIYHFLHPDGRLKDQDLQSDRQGRVKDRKGSAKHAMSKELKPTMQMAKTFAKDLAKIVDQARKDRKFDRLVLVAPSDFMGLLNQSLSKQSLEIILATVRKDFMTMDEFQIQDRVDSILTSLFPNHTSESGVAKRSSF